MSLALLVLPSLSPEAGTTSFCCCRRRVVGYGCPRAVVDVVDLWRFGAAVCRAIMFVALSDVLLDELLLLVVRSSVVDC